MGLEVEGEDVAYVSRVCLASVLLLWACSSFALEGMAVQSRVEAIVVGDTVTLSVVALDGSMPSASSVAWASSDSEIATVDELGVVTGTGPGVVAIEARTGDYTINAPLLVWTTAGPFVSVAAGFAHNCALGEDGSAWCWGSNQYRQLGSAFAPDRCFFTSRDFLPCAPGAIPVDTDLRFTELVVGFYHNCGLSAAGAAYCWGLNDAGQLGDGGTETRAAPEPVQGAHVFKSLIAEGRTTCGITNDEALLCWGRDLTLVNGTSADILTTPTHVAAEHRFTHAVTSGDHTCGVTPAGSTYCWGDNSRGQLGVAGVGTTCDSFRCMREPQEVASAPPFVAFALGGGFSCGLTAAGVAHCWGDNERGQLGDGTRTDRWEPMAVAGGHTFTRLEAARDRACGLDEAGALYCWGRDPASFGTGGDLVEIDQPMPSAAGLKFTAITIGFDTQGGVAHSGVTWCWGSNWIGAVGNGRMDRSALVAAPMRVVLHPLFAAPA